MKTWLNPVIRALNARRDPLDLFFRNEDVGWLDDGLFGMIDLFVEYGLPLDLAVIPESASPLFAERLLFRLRQGFRLGVHQHGFAHINHERNGPMCEFGPSRSAGDQRRDIAAGRRKLLGLFGEFVDPIFSPPWDQCTVVTGRCLLDCGLSVLSRDRSAGMLGVPGLAECPTRVDWFAQIDGVRLSRVEWAQRLAQDITVTGQPLGIKICHAVMDEEDQHALGQLLQLFGRHPAVNAVLMRHALAMPMWTYLKC